MSKSADFDVAYVAQLARLSLTPEETQLFQKQLGDVLRYVQKLQEVDVTDVEPTTHAVPLWNVFREDEARESFTADEALANAPRKLNQLFLVTKVLE